MIVGNLKHIIRKQWTKIHITNFNFLKPFHIYCRHLTQSIDISCFGTPGVERHFSPSLVLDMYLTDTHIIVGNEQQAVKNCTTFRKIEILYLESAKFVICTFQIYVVWESDTVQAMELEWTV